MNEEIDQQLLTIYSFRDDLAEDLLDLYRQVMLAEQAVQRLKGQSQALTYEKQCRLQDKVYDKNVNHFTVQRQLMLLEDKLSAIVASFKHGNLANILTEASEWKVF